MNIPDGESHRYTILRTYTSDVRQGTPVVKGLTYTVDKYRKNRNELCPNILASRYTNRKSHYTMRTECYYKRI